MIDEKKLIEEIKYLLFNSEMLSPRWFAINEMFEIIKRQPEVGEWIPVSSGRLPKVGEYVLGTNNYDEVLVYRYGWNSPHSKKMFFHLCGAAGNVIAWMPRPEPYSERGEGE